jgi:dUTP pyrophosphatase
MRNIVKVLRLDPRAIIPTKGSKSAAKYDVSVLEDVHVHWSTVTMTRTGLAFEVPEGYYLEVVPRSGLSKKGLRLANVPATLDSDYRGELLLLLTIKYGFDDMNFKSGDRVMQCALHRVEPCQFVEAVELTPTERGEQGFGSTGLKSLRGK